MATTFLSAPTRHAGPLPRLLLSQYRTTAARCIATSAVPTASGPPQAPVREDSALARLSTKSLTRSLVLTSLMSSQWLMRPSIAVLGFIAGSKSALLNPDRNPLLNRLLRWTIYNHFCAGVNRHEVRKSVAEYNNLGFQGVILTHAREILLENAGTTASGKDATVYGPAHYRVVEEWKKNSIDTLRMLQAGDFLALKLTGAGPIAVDALKANRPIPEAVAQALDEICAETRKQGSRLWFDAEQQGLQPAIDEWAIEMMRKWNLNGEAVVYNTIQAYLKASKANAERHITLAAKQGWTVGIKLVRGAYIENEVRSLIHDTKEDTDRCYDAIADQLVSQILPAEAAAEGLKFPSAALMLATHNAESTAKACLAHRQRVEAGQVTCAVDCAQIAGMADELSCELVQRYEDSLAGRAVGMGPAPRSLKCLTWGSVGECLGYLHRRAIENQGAVSRTKHMAAALRKEMWRRVLS